METTVNDSMLKLLGQDLRFNKNFRHITDERIALKLQLIRTTNEKRNLITMVRKLKGNNKEVLSENVLENISDEDLQLIRKALHIVDGNVGNTDFNVSVFIHKMGVSKTRLHNKLKQLTGLSASEFNRNRRLYKALSLLKEGKSSVSEVAYVVGFSDPRYFAKCFKKRYGKSPSVYAANLNISIK